MSLDEILLYIENLLGTLSQQVTDFIAAGINNMSGYVSGLSNTISNYFVDVGRSLTNYVADIFATVTTQIQAILKPIADSLDTMVAHIQQALDAMVTSLTDLFKQMWDRVMDTVNNVMNHVSDLVRDVRDYIMNLIQSGIDAVTNLVGQVTDWVKSLVDEAIGGVRAVWRSAVDGVTVGVSQLIVFVKQALTSVADVVQAEWRKLVTGAESIITTVDSRITSFDTTVRDIFGNLPASLANLTTEQLVPLKESLVSFCEYFSGKPGVALQPEWRESVEALTQQPLTGEKVQAFMQRSWTHLNAAEGAGADIFFGIMTLIGVGIFAASAASIQAQVLQQDLALTMPWLPLPANDAIASYRKHGMSADDAMLEIRKAGLSAASAARMLNASEAPPAPGDVLALWKRGLADSESVDKALFSAGLSSEWAARVKAAADIIPPVSDIITMAVREAFSPEIASRFGQYEDFPPDLGKYAALQGLTDDWARRYWAAHWNLPSPQQGFEMLHRGEIDAPTLTLLLKALDVMPFWRDKLINIAYHPLNRIDIRRMHKTGTLTDAQLPALYGKLGYTPDDARLMAEFTIKVNARKDTAVDAELGKLTRATVVKWYAEKLIDNTKAIDLLKTLGVTEQAARLYLAAEDLNNHHSERKAESDHIVELARAGAITKLDAETQLRALGLEEAEVQAALTKLERALRKTVKVPARGDLDTFLTQGLITDADYLATLQIDGFTERWAKIYLASAKEKANVGKKRV